METVRRERRVSIQRGLIAMSEFEGRPAETDLLRAAQTGDRAAMDRLLALHERPLLVLCHGMLGHADDAEDAVQETFLRALHALPGFRGASSLRTWLFRIAVNVCLNWKRDRRHDPAELGAGPWDAEGGGFSPITPSPEAIALQQLHIVEALGELPPRLRVVFLLKVLEGWSVAEIAVAMRWNPIRVQNELAKARRVLAEWRRRDAEEGAER
jgi:RNA polymerase sigma-70 factor (ECF subfamily)